METAQRQKKRVVVAMSGGVDSSVAAALMKDEGHEVIGISMQLYDHSDQETRFDSCCSLKEVDGARRVAQILNIPFYLLNFEKVFKEKVVDYFVDEYLKTRTPNPCIKCNEDVKFQHLILKAKELKADYLVTGHYVKTRFNEETQSYELLKGKDPQKDQSYFLFSILKKELPFLHFPLADLTKSQVREIARRKKLPTAEKKESMEICFIPNNNYGSFIDKQIDGNKKSNLKGNIIDKDGKKLGEHAGTYKYTIGQRKGIGVYQSDPLYVLDVNSNTNDVTVGKNEDLMSKGLMAKEINWITLPKSDDVYVRIRYRHQEIPGKLVGDWRKEVDETEYSTRSNQVKVEFSTPQRAVAPGQAAVFYNGDVLLGGGWIESAYA